MKKVAITAGIGFLLTMASLSFGHGGFVLTEPAIVKLDTSLEGYPTASIKNNMLSEKELALGNELKRYLVKNYGLDAIDWPYMLLWDENSALVKPAHPNFEEIRIDFSKFANHLD
jgi:hypothetical protein